MSPCLCYWLHTVAFQCPVSSSLPTINLDSFLHPPVLSTTSPLQLHLIPATWLVNLINKPSGVIISTWDSLLYKKYCWYFYKSVGTCEASFIDTINFWYNHNTSHAYIGILGFCTSIVCCKERHGWDLKSLNGGLEEENFSVSDLNCMGNPWTKYLWRVFTITTL